MRTLRQVFLMRAWMQPLMGISTDFSEDFSDEDFIEDDSEGDDYEDFTDESIDEPGQYGSDDTEAAG